MSFVIVKKIKATLFLLCVEIFVRNIGYLGTLQILLQGDELTVCRCSNLLAPRQENYSII
jgi:hypothetical protein